MKKIEVLYYEGITEGLYVKFKIDNQIEWMEVSVSNDDIFDYLKAHYPEEVAETDVEDVDALTDAYSIHECEIDNYFISDALSAEYPEYEVYNGFIKEI